MKIITKYKTNVIDFDFDSITQDKVMLDLEAINYSKPENVLWRIFDKEEQLDLGDLTKGNKAELMLLKSYCGAPDRPNIFTVEATDLQTGKTDKIQLRIFAKLVINNASWVLSELDYFETKVAYINTNIRIKIEGNGLFDIPLKIDFYRKGNLNPIFSLSSVLINNFSDATGLYLSEKIKAFEIIKFYTRDFKIYFIIRDKQNNQPLYNGELHNKFLTILLDLFELKKEKEEKEETSLSVAVLHTDEYFTQRYEPCKYEKIKLSYGDEAKIIFDEKQTTQKRYSKFEINFLAGKETTNKKKFEIQLLNVDTRECQYNDENKKLTDYRDEDHKEKLEEKRKDHKNNTFFTDELYDAGILEFDKSESSLSFVPRYFYNEDDYLRFLAQFLLDGPEKAKIEINTCRYHHNLELNIYPDAVAIAHFQFKYPTEDYYFKGHVVKNKLQEGISDVIDELVKSPLFQLTKFLPMHWLVTLKIVEYIKTQAKDYKYGAHLIHCRTIEKPGEALILKGKEVDLVLDTKYGRYLAALPIYGFVLLGLLIDLLMIYLTRGRNLTGRLAVWAKRVKSVQTILKKIEDQGIELFPPAIAINAGMYYYVQKDNRVARVYEVNLKFNPLVAINFEKEFDLLEMLTRNNEVHNAQTPQDEETKRKLARNAAYKKAIVKALGVQEAKGKLTVKGEINFEHHVKYHLLSGKAEIQDIVGNGIATAKDERLITQQITMNAVMDVTAKKDFYFKILYAKTEINLNAELTGALALKLKYGVNKMGLFVQQKLYFSGVEGFYTGVLKKRAKFFGNDYESEYKTNDGKPTPFTLIEPFELETFNIQLFNHQ